MWIPESADDIIRATNNHEISETSTFEVKAAEAVESNKDRHKKEMAKDIAAMSTYGGVILYGVREDQNDEPTVPDPVDLTGKKEKISNVVQTCIDPPPNINIYVRRKQNDRSKGFIVIEVPQSPDAPHMVLKNKDRRYYGRNGPRNVRMTGSEVEQLFERRRDLQRDRQELLDDLADHATIRPKDEKSEWGYLRIALKPATPRDEVLASLLDPGDQAQVNNTLSTLVSQAEEEVDFAGRGDQNHFTRGPNWTPELEAYRGNLGTSGDSRHARRYDVWVGHGGALYFNAGSVAAEKQTGKEFNEYMTVALSAKILYFAGRLFEKADYRGQVDIALRVSGLEGAVSVYGEHPMGFRDERVERDTFESDTRTSVSDLAKSPKSVVRSLLGPLIRHTTRGNEDDVLE